MIDIRPVLQVAGILLATLALAMFLPMTVDLVAGNDDWQVFLGAGFLTLFIGMALFLTNRTGTSGLTVRQAPFLLTTIAWIVLCAFAALPFALADLGLDYADALFEATAGLTTTGATVVTDLQSRQEGILLWRALLQWMGGIGIIVTAVAVLPMLRIAGMQLFSTESSDQEKMLPRTVRIAGAITTIYAVFSVLCFLSYWTAGMSGFDALAHAMTTVSTAGFSTHDGSIGVFDNAHIELVAMVFMISGAPALRHLPADGARQLPAAVARCPATPVHGDHGGRHRPSRGASALAGRRLRAVLDGAARGRVQHRRHCDEHRLHHGGLQRLERLCRRGLLHSPVSGRLHRIDRRRHQDVPSSRAGRDALHPVCAA